MVLRNREIYSSEEVDGVSMVMRETNHEIKSNLVFKVD